MEFDATKPPQEERKSHFDDSTEHQKIRQNSETSERSYKEEMKDKVPELDTAAYLNPKTVSKTFHFAG